MAAVSVLEKSGWEHLDRKLKLIKDIVDDDARRTAYGTWAAEWGFRARREGEDYQAWRKAADNRFRKRMLKAAPEGGAERLAVVEVDAGEAAPAPKRKATLRDFAGLEDTAEPGEQGEAVEDQAEYEMACRMEAEAYWKKADAEQAAGEQRALAAQDQAYMQELEASGSDARAEKGDHGINGINALRNPDAATRPRPANPLTPLRKTPSPKPPSPTPKPPSPTTTPKPPSPIPSLANYRASKTPTPPPPPMIGSRSGPSSDRRSPKLDNTRSSPQSSRGSNSPTEGPPKNCGSRCYGHARSMSASSTPAPTPTPGSMPSAAARPLLERQRSKSQASERERVGVGAEARKPDARRPPPNVETVDRSTQTEGEDYDEGEDEHATIGLAEVGADQSEFLEKHLMVTTELEMAVRAQMERLAGHEGKARAAAPGPAPGPAPPSTGRGSSSAHFHGRRLRLAKTAAEANSDGEDAAGPDDEVRSLALSEDGPELVMKRSISEPLHIHAARKTAPAPDPIAMLTGGERKGTDALPTLAARSRSFHVDERWIHADLASERERPLNKQRALGEFGADIDGEPLGSDHSAPNDSDKSAAPTYTALEAAQASAGDGHVVGAPADEEAVLGAATNLIPILEKVTAHATLEVVQEGDGAAARSTAAAAAARKAWKANARHVPALRKEVQALDLSDLRVKGGLERGLRPPGPGIGSRSFDSDAKSDVSFGSAQSAFECYSSPSSSQLNSPRGRTELKAAQSMPLLAPHKR